MVPALRHLFTPQYSNNQRPRILHVEGLLVLSLILLFSFACTHLLRLTSPSILGFSSSITPSQVIDQTNRARAENGLLPLINNSELARAAQAKGNYMCSKQFWAHIAPDGTTPWIFIKNAGYQYAVAGENLARDFADTGSVLSAWMASPTHRANIVNDRYKDIGVAVVDCNLLGSDTALVIQMFGSQLAGSPQVTQNAATAKITRPAVGPKASPVPNQPEVAGTESVPKLIAGTNLNLVLPTPPPQANPQGLRALSPLQVIKAVMISILIVLILVLFMDLWLEHSRHTVRIAGKNLAHILFLCGIFLVVIFIRAGRIS